MLPKFIVYSLSFIVLILSTTSIALAQTATPSALQPTTYNLPATVSPASPLYTDLLVNNLFHSFSCLAIGQSMIGQPCLSYQVTKNAQGMIQSVPVLSQTNLSGGALGATTGLIGALYQNPPVRTADYLASLSGGFGIIRQANAQAGVGGSGAAVLNPIISLWQVSRNISYVIMILIFMVIGLMIMFRNKINPQTVITAQAALPGLVIGLIMITFSYFFAGLISDMAFVGTNIVGYYFSAVRGETSDPQDLLEDVENKNVLMLLTPFTKVMSSDKISAALTSIWDDLADPSTNRLLPWDLDPQKALTNLAMIIIAQFLMPFGGMFGGVGQIVVGGLAVAGTVWNTQALVAVSLSFVAMIAIIYAMFRLLLRLVNNFLTIIVLTITAPFQLLFAALPGRQGIATGWILNMLANVLAFPAVLAVMYFIAFLLGPKFVNDHRMNPPFKVVSAGQTQNQALVPSVYAEDKKNNTITITDSTTFPLFGSLNIEFINLLLAFGALIALPSIPDIVQRSIAKASQAGELIGREIGSNVGQGRQYAGQFQQGTSGFAGQVGRLTDKQGYLGVEKFDDPLNTKKVTGVKWEKSWQPTTGAQRGAISSIKGFFKK